MRVQTVLRIVMAVLVVGIVLVSGLLLRFVFAGGRPAAPRTELERAVFEAEEAVKANPNDATARTKLAAAYLEQRSNGRALEQAEYAVRLEPSDPTPYYVLGMAQDANGRTDEALKTLRKAVDTKGQMAQFYQDTYVALARVQEKKGDIKGAVSSMEKAISQGPENILVLIAAGNLDERQKRYYDAAANYMWALYYDPDDVTARAGVERLAKIAPKDVKKAADVVAKAAAQDKRSGVHAPVSDPATGTK